MLFVLFVIKIVVKTMEKFWKTVKKRCKAVKRNRA